MFLVPRLESLLKKTNLLPLLLLLVLCSQCVYFAATAGQTVDETYYNGSGYPMVRYNNYKFLGEHPPFIIQLGALPLLFLQPQFPIQNFIRLPGSNDVDISKTGALFLYKMGNDPRQILLWERLPIVALTVLLGLGIFVWGRELYGEWGALLALFLYVFTPDIIGNGGLYTTDMGLTVLYFFAIYALQKFFERPNLKRCIVLGVLCGLTFMSKISGLILFPIVTFLFMVFLVIDPKAKSLPPLPAAFDKRFGILAIFLLINAIAQKQAMVTLGPLCLVAVYLCVKNLKFFSGSRYRSIALKGLLIAGYILAFVFSFKLKRKYGIEASLVFVAWNTVAALLTCLLFKFENKNTLLTPVKLFLAIWLFAALVIVLGYTDFLYKFYRFVGFGNFVKPFGIALSHSLAGHRGCVEGSFITCDWRYFFGVLAIKTPLLPLCLSLLGIILLFRFKTHPLTKAVLLTPAVFFLGAAIFNKINIGLRHILPIFPFLFLLGGLPGALLAAMKNGFLKVVLAAGLAVALLFFAARTLQTAPDYLTYFNEAIGGPEQGVKLVGDSNLNWGQDNKRLAEFVIARNIPSVKIASETSNPDLYDYYKIPWQWIKESDLERPEPGFYALTIGFYMGLQKNPRSWFNGKQPDFKAGKTFYIFKVPEKL